MILGEKCYIFEEV